MKLETLILEFGADFADLDAALNQANKKAESTARDIEWHLKKIGNLKTVITPTVDHRPLEELNQHLTVKEKHIDKLNKKVIKVKVDDTELQKIANKTVVGQTKVQSNNEVKQKVEVSTKNANLELLTEIKAVTKEIKEVVKAVSKLKPTAIGSALSTVGSSLVQGVAFNATKNFGKSLMQSIDNQIADTLGSTSLVAKQIVDNFFGGINQSIDFAENKLDAELGKPDKKQNKNLIEFLSIFVKTKEEISGSLSSFIDSEKKELEKFANTAKKERQNRKKRSDANQGMLFESQRLYRMTGAAEAIAGIQSKYQKQSQPLQQQAQIQQQTFANAELKIAELEDRRVTALSTIKQAKSNLINSDQAKAIVSLKKELDNIDKQIQLVVPGIDDLYAKDLNKQKQKVFSQLKSAQSALKAQKSNPENLKNEKTITSLEKELQSINQELQLAYEQLNVVIDNLNSEEAIALQENIQKITADKKAEFQSVLKAYQVFNVDDQQSVFAMAEGLNKATASQSIVQASEQKIKELNTIKRKVEQKIVEITQKLQSNLPENVKKDLSEIRIKLIKEYEKINKDLTLAENIQNKEASTLKKNVAPFLDAKNKSVEVSQKIKNQIELTSYNSLITDILKSVTDGQIPDANDFPAIVPDSRIPDGKGVYSIDTNTIKLHPDNYKRIMSGNPDVLDTHILAHEMTHAVDAGFGEFQNIANMYMGGTNLNNQFADNITADLEKFVQQYDSEKERPAEFQAEGRAREKANEIIQKQYEKIGVRPPEINADAVKSQILALSNLFNEIEKIIPELIDDEAIKIAQEELEQSRKRSLQMIESFVSFSSLIRKLNLTTLPKPDAKKFLELQISIKEAEAQALNLKNEIIQEIKNVNQSETENSTTSLNTPDLLDDDSLWASMGESIDNAVETAGEVISSGIQRVAHTFVDKLDEIATNQINNILLQPKNGVIDLNAPQIGSVSELGLKEVLTLTKIGTQQTLSGINQGFKTLLPAIKTGYGVLRGAENFALNMLPFGHTAKGIAKNIALPAAAFGMATHALPGGTAVAEGLTNLLGGATSPLINGIAGQVTEIVAGQLSSIPIVGGQLSALATQGISGAAGIIGSGVAEAGTAILGGQVLLNTSGQAAKAVLSGENRQELLQLPSSTAKISSQTELALEVAGDNLKSLASAAQKLEKELRSQLTGVTPQLKLLGTNTNKNYLNLLPEKKRESFLEKQTEYEQALIKYEQTDSPEAKIPTPPQLSKIDKQTIAKNLRIEDVQREVSYVIQNADALRKASQDAIDRVNNLLAKVPKNERFGHPLASLKGNLTQLKESAENVNPIYDLKKLGVNKEILDAIDVKSQVIPEMANTGSNIVSGLVQGLNSKLAELETVSIDIASTPLEITKQINKIQSPSKEFEEIGKNIIEGEIKGIKSKEKDLQATMAIIAKNMIENYYLATKNPVNIAPFFLHQIEAYQKQSPNTFIGDIQLGQEKIQGVSYQGQSISQVNQKAIDQRLAHELEISTMQKALDESLSDDRFAKIRELSEKEAERTRKEKAEKEAWEKSRMQQPVPSISPDKALGNNKIKTEKTEEKLPLYTPSSIPDPWEDVHKTVRPIPVKPVSVSANYEDIARKQVEIDDQILLNIKKRLQKAEEKVKALKESKPSAVNFDAISSSPIKEVVKVYAETVQPIKNTASSEVIQENIPQLTASIPVPKADTNRTKNAEAKLKALQNHRKKAGADIKSQRQKIQEAEKALLLFNEAYKDTVERFGLMSEEAFNILSGLHETETDLGIQQKKLKEAQSKKRSVDNTIKLLTKDKKIKSNKVQQSVVIPQPSVSTTGTIPTIGLGGGGGSKPPKPPTVTGFTPEPEPEPSKKSSQDIEARMNALKQQIEYEHAQEKVGSNNKFKSKSINRANDALNKYEQFIEQEILKSIENRSTGLNDEGLNDEELNQLLKRLKNKEKELDKVIDYIDRQNNIIDVIDSEFGGSFQLPNGMGPIDDDFGFKEFFQTLRQNNPIIDKTISLVNRLFISFVGAEILQNVGMLFRQFATESFQSALNMERLETALNFSTGNAESSLTNLKIQADRLGTSFLSSAKNYQQFSSAVINTPLEFQKDRIFEGITLGLATRGADSQQQDRALLAITQIASKGRVSMEELNSQLGEALPGALQIAARAYGVTSQEFIKLIESGTVASDEFLSKFATQTTLESAGGINAINDTAFVQITRFQNQMESLRISLGKPLLEATKLGLPSVTKALKVLTENGELVATVLASIGIVTVGSFVMVLKNLGLIDLALKALGVTAKTTGGSISQIGVGLLKGLGWTALIYSVMEAFKALYQYINAGSEESKRSLKSTQESLQELRRLLEKSLPTPKPSTVITDSATAIEQFKNNRERGKSLEFTAGGLSDTTQILRLSTDTFSDTKITEFTSKLDALRQKAKDLKIDEILASGDADVKKATSVRQEIAKVNQEIQALTEKYFPQIGLIVNEIASTEERITAIKKVLDNPESSKSQKDNASIQLEVAEVQLRKLKESQEKYNEAVKENLINYQRLTEQINKVARALSNIEFISSGQTILSETGIKRQVLSGNLKPFEIDLTVKEQSLSIIKNQFNSLNILLTTKEKELQNTLTDEINQRITDLMPELNGLDFKTALQQGFVSPEAIGERLQQLGDAAPFELKQVLETAKQQASIRQQTLNMDKSIVDSELEIRNIRQEQARNARQASIVEANVNERIATLRELPFGGAVASYRDALSEVRNQERLLQEAYRRLENASEDPNVIRQEIDNIRLALEQAKANLLQQQQSLEDYYRNLNRQIIDFNRQIEDYKRRLVDFKRQIQDAKLSAFKENRSLSESYTDLVKELDKNILNLNNELKNIEDKIKLQKLKNSLLIPGGGGIGREINNIILQYLQSESDIAGERRSFKSKSQEIESNYIASLRRIRDLQEQQIEAEKNRLRTTEDLKRSQIDLKRSLEDLIRNLSDFVRNTQRELGKTKTNLENVNGQILAIAPKIKTSGDILANSIKQVALKLTKLDTAITGKNATVNKLPQISSVTPLSSNKPNQSLNNNVHSTNQNRSRTRDELNSLNKSPIRNEIRPYNDSNQTALNRINAIRNRNNQSIQPNSNPSSNQNRSRTRNELNSLNKSPIRNEIDPNQTALNRINAIRNRNNQSIQPNSNPSSNQNRSRTRDELNSLNKSPIRNEIRPYNDSNQTALNRINAIRNRNNQSIQPNSNPTPTPAQSLEWLQNQNRNVILNGLKVLEQRFKNDASQQAIVKGISALRQRLEKNPNLNAQKETKNLLDVLKNPLLPAYQQFNRTINWLKNGVNQIRQIFSPKKSSVNDGQLYASGISDMGMYETEPLTRSDILKLDPNSRFERFIPQNIPQLPTLPEVPEFDFTVPKQQVETIKTLDTNLLNEQQTLKDLESEYNRLTAIDSLLQSQKQIFDNLLSTKRAIRDASESVADLTLNAKGYLTVQEEIKKAVIDVSRQYRSQKESLEDQRRNILEEIRKNELELARTNLLLTNSNLPPTVREEYINTTIQLTQSTSELKNELNLVNENISKIDGNRALAEAMTRDRIAIEKNNEALSRYNSMMADLADRREITDPLAAIFGGGGEKLRIISDYRQKLYELDDYLRSNSELFTPEQMQEMRSGLIEMANTDLTKAFVDANPVLSGFRDLVKGAVTDFENLGQTALNILESIASKLLDNGLNLLLGNLFGGGGVGNLLNSSGGLGSLFGGGGLGGGLAAPITSSIPFLESGATFGLGSLSFFATGGTVGETLQNERAISGKQPELVVAHRGEEILTTLNKDAQFWRALKRSGQWDELKTNGGMPAYAYGGTVGGSSGSTVTMSRTRSPIVNNTTFVINANDPNSFRSTESQIKERMERRNREVNERYR